MTGLGAVAQLLECIRINVRGPYVEFQVQALPQGVGSFYHHVECVDAVYGDVALCRYLRPGVVEIDADKNAELIGQDDSAFPLVAATLQPVRPLRCSLVQRRHQM